MHLRIWDGSGLADIQPPDLKDYARAGVYVCCGASGHQGACGNHLWVYVGTDPIPHHNILLNRIRTEVPHVNGHGSHA